ncbi:hypothetical protein [Albibacterium sp.]|uniref:hypothetical protein n=1 Tax=Albibacterium sp. TaxID=2952885 RepID=UPI002C5DB6D8|nr:hypothetical protein [Albibacterium sp.]HUH17996.1 hypothetical protein [Albibacterium sp.]
MTEYKKESHAIFYQSFDQGKIKIQNNLWNSCNSFFDIMNFINLGENDKIKVFDWFYFAIFLTLGIGHVIEGAGIPLVEIFGAKAYIQVDAEKIVLK